MWPQNSANFVLADPMRALVHPVLDVVGQAGEHRCGHRPR
jgi:hypothetical protein